MEEEKNLDTAEKIRLMAEYFHLNSAQFAKKIGVSPSKIYDINRGQIKNFSPEILEKILQNCPEISPIWLMTGKGEMVNSKYAMNIGTQQGNNYTGDNVYAAPTELINLLSSQQATISKQTDQIDRLIAIIESKIK